MNNDIKIKESNDIIWTPTKAYKIAIPENTTLKEIIYFLNNIGMEYYGDEKSEQYKQLKKFLVKK